MTNHELASLLEMAAARLRGHEAPIEAPPGMVVVRPTGPKGAGKARLYPAPVEGDTVSSYVDRHQKSGTQIPALGRSFSVNDAGRFFMNPTPMRWEPAQDDVLNYLDYRLHEMDWFDQEELDRIAAIEERDRREGYIWSPRK